VSHLSGETIGKILGRISQIKDSDFQDQNKIVESLTDILMEGINPIKYANRQIFKRQTIEKQIKNLIGKREKPSCSEENKEILTAQIESLSEVIRSLNAEEPPSVPFEIHSLMKKKTEKDFKEIARLIVESLKESRLIVPPSTQSRYPKNLPEQALMGFFLEKANHKKDFIPLLKSMPVVLSDAGKAVIQPGEAQERFIQSRYQLVEFKPENLLEDPAKAAEVFKQDPGKLVFAIMEDSLHGAKKFPKELSYTTVPHPALGGGKLPDCGETAARNWWNRILWDPSGGRGKFNAAFFDEMEAKGAEIDPALRHFYRLKHSDPADAANEKQYKEWADKVMSQRHEQGIKYIKPAHNPVCEINVGVKNMRNMIALQLGLKGEREDENTEVWDQICETVSRPDFKLTWDMSEEDRNKMKQLESKASPRPSPPVVHIAFSINGKKAFDWMFDYGPPGHFVITFEREAEKESWKSKVRNELAMDILSEAPAYAGNSKVDQISHLLPLLSDAKFLDQTKDLLAPHLRERLIHALPLSNAEERIKAFEAIFASHPEQIQSMKPLATHLRAKLPEEADVDMAKRIHTALSNAYYPFDEEVHPVGKPDVVYRKVMSQELERHFGENAAKRMGRSWRIEMFRHQIAMGEPLTGDDGKEKKLNFEDAKKACLDLNPPHKRNEIEIAFLEREKELDHLRIKHKSKLKAGERDQLSSQEQEEFETVLRNKPIQGCYLLSREEWKQLESDFGIQERKYIPQILPGLKNRWFWSSSGSSFDAYYAFHFNGSDGGVISGNRNLNESVRCACAAAW
jgi:hypothetical protein